MQLDALDHVGLAVSDMAASIEFYQGVLGLTRAHEATWGDYPAVFEGERFWGRLVLANRRLRGAI